MLTLKLTKGEFVAIGKDIAVRYNRTDGGGIQISIEAPADVEIVRGTLVKDHWMHAKRNVSLKERLKGRKSDA